MAHYGVFQHQADATPSHLYNIVSWIWQIAKGAGKCTLGKHDMNREKLTSPAGLGKPPTNARKIKEKTRISNAVNSNYAISWNTKTYASSRISSPMHHRISHFRFLICHHSTLSSRLSLTFHASTLIPARGFPKLHHRLRPANKVWLLSYQLRTFAGTGFLGTEKDPLPLPSSQESKSKLNLGGPSLLLPNGCGSGVQGLTIDPSAESVLGVIASHILIDENNSSPLWWVESGDMTRPLLAIEFEDLEEFRWWWVLRGEKTFSTGDWGWGNGTATATSAVEIPRAMLVLALILVIGIFFKGDYG